ncbi:hypothetical protein [Novosphingobium olei]|uniref:Uncharacterized protein n=1 Tax=Novosphingobium olei TaxID=2728851 RepID=A0A7Y0BT70_9SPHN|nr:hypothetical protein [Novosphingobium olei]NML96119.1 hypothetical protein [Novosphingobium olei]
MDFDDQMQRYFGSTDLGAVSPAALEAGKERLAVDFGLEQDRGRRFAMWALMHILGNAPDLDVAFKETNDRNAARDFMDMLGRVTDN